MTHVVITRLLYKDYETFKKRLELYKKTVLSCLKKQTDKNFDIAILCNPKHAQEIKDLGIVPFFLKDRSLGKKINGFWTAFTPWENTEGLGKYDIQTSLDSDDLFVDNFIETIVNISKGDKSIHINFQPTLFHLFTKESKKMVTRYGSMGSPIFSIYQPNKDKYYFAHHDSHLKMPQYLDKSILIEEGYCQMAIHNDNISSTMNI